MESFGQRVRRARSRAGISQRALAEAAGLSQGALAQWEGGQIIEVGAARAIRVAQALRVRPAWLVLGEGPMAAAQPDVDPVALTGAVETVSEALQVAGVRLPPDKYAAAVAVVYQVIAAGEPPGDLVPRLLTLSR